jgi:hypothetical protein
MVAFGIDRHADHEVEGERLGRAPDAGEGEEEGRARPAPQTLPRPKATRARRWGAGVGLGEGQGMKALKRRATWRSISGPAEASKAAAE